ncbi:MAG: tetratricopeptide repeat protein, partial [Ardenticatenaceae bacterium]|nr:tetratricopeptide repeat protein [Ardenticatenaceae bacterium]
MNHHLVPRFILQKMAVGEKNGRFSAATLFVDISGFTAVTEQLMRYDRAGAETLANVMAAIFTPLVEAVYARGGFVAGFAGDAFTAVFPTANPLQATAAAWEMQQLMASIGRQTTPYGTFTFAATVGVALGAVDWGIVGDEAGRHSYYFRGEAIEACAAAEHLAAGGEVALTAATAEAVASVGEVVALADGFGRLVGLQLPPKNEDDGEMRWVGGETAVLFHPPNLLTTDVHGEFRQVLTLFVNIDQPEPAALAALMGQLLPLLHQYGGYLCRLDFGDKGCNLLLFWGAPTSHENDIERALGFALDLAALSPLPLRMGATYRLVYAGFAGSPRREEYTCYGLSVNLAARLMLAAPWGEIWLDAAVAQRAIGYEVVLAAQQRFKGFSAAQSVFRLGRRREQVAAFYGGALVGREVELGWLQTAVSPLLAGQFGGAAVVVGEAGVGKSRLVHALAQSGVGQTVQWFRCQTDEILRQPLNPFCYFLYRYFEQSLTASEATNKANFENKLRQLMATTADEGLVNELARTRSFLGSLVDLYWPGSLYERLEPQWRQENQLRALKTVLRAESLRRPLVVQVEDAHWLDETSRQFLPILLRNMAGYPLLLLLTSREPLAMEPEPQLLRLQPLGETAVSQLAATFLQATPAPALLAMLQARAEGNPFFVEQILLYLREQGGLEKTAVGYDLGRETAVLPADVQAILIARLDRLAQSVRDVVQTAAVLGREFEIQVLSQMLRGMDGVAEKVRLAEAEAIWAALSELRYLFRHALLRDAAYEMQLQERLRQLHQTAAAAIEQLFAADLSPYYASLFYHYGRAGMEEPERRYARLAGEQAASRFANAEALAYLSRALVLTPETESATRFELLLQREGVQGHLGLREAQGADLAEMEQLAVANPLWQLEVWLRWADYEMLLGNFGRSVALAQQVVAMAQPLALPALTARGHLQHGRSLSDLADLPGAWAQLEQALALAQAHGLMQVEANARLNMGYVLDEQESIQAAIPYYEQAIALFRQLDDLVGECKTANNLGVSLVALSQYEAAETFYNLGLQLGRQIGFRRAEAVCLSNLANLAAKRGDLERAQATMVDSLQIALELGDVVQEARIYNNLGFVAMDLGAYEAGRQYHERALVLRQQMGMQMSVGDSLLNLAFLYHQMGENVTALRLVDEALGLAQEIRHEVAVSNTLKIRGHVLVGLGRLGEATAVYEEAIAIQQASEAGNDATVLECQGGLARILGAQEAWEQALVLVEMVLAELTQAIPDSVHELPRLYLTCYHVLQANGHRDRANEVLG